MTVLTDAQLDVWREREVERRKDAADIEFNRKRDERRRVVRAEMITFLDDFLSGRITLQQFKDTFDRKTRKDWDVFGLKGMSAAGFLNTLVKHLPDQADVTNELRHVLPVHESTTKARAKLQSFHDYLTDFSQQGVVTRRQIHSRCALHFL